jgi:hypothetical protein
MIKAFLTSAILLTASSSWAVGPCDLAYQVSGNLGEMMTKYQSSDISQLMIDLEKECSLETRIKALRLKMDVESNQLYKAMKYVDARFYSSAKNVKPVSKIYQTTKAAGKLPLNEQSDIIWQNFVLGYSALPAETQLLKNGETITSEMLKRIHKGFYQLSNEVGDFAHEPHPGTFFHERTPKEKDQKAWWSQNINQEIINDVHSINSDALNWGLLKDTRPVNEIPIYLIRVTETEVFRANSSEHKALIANVLNFTNDYLKIINSVYQLEPKVGLPLLSPMRLAIYAQKTFVSIHPFIEGNGRTSRFLQDMIMSYFDLPAINSGELMNVDTLMPFDDYYNLALDKTEEMLARMEFCARNPKSKDYDCERL